MQFQHFRLVEHYVLVCFDIKGNYRIYYTTHSHESLFHVLNKLVAISTHSIFKKK